MAVIWNLQRASTVKTLAEWGAVGVSLSFQNLGEDLLTFTIPVAQLDGDGGWARDQAVILFRDNVRVFAGIVENNPEGNAESTAESLAIRVVGPWFYLTHTVMTQAWPVWDTTLNGGEGGLTTGTKTRVTLGLAANGDRLTTGGVITEALNKASASGTRYTVGTIDPAVSMPLDEATDLMCSEVIMKMLRWTPDAVGWFDYTQSPPAFHCRRSSGLTLDTYSAGDGSNVVAWTSRPRGDLKQDGVIIKYETVTTNAAGAMNESITEERSPAEATEGNPRVLVMTIPLDGVNTSMQSCQLTTELIPSNLNDLTNATTLAWWRARLPVLVGVDAADITMSASRTETDRLYELIDGSIPDWLASTANVTSDTITGTVIYKKNGQKFQEVLAHKMTVCSLQTGTKKKVHREGGEAAPVGLAAAFMAAVGTLYYDGQVSLVYDDVPAGPFLGRRAQAPTGGVGVVQSAQVEIETGKVDITFGPPAHLGPADMIEFMRANRSRMTCRSVGRRTSAEAGAGAPDIQTGGASVRHNTVSSPAGQYTQGETTPGIGLVVPAATADYQTLVAVTPSEDATVASGQRAWRPGPPRVMNIP